MADTSPPGAFMTRTRGALLAGATGALGLFVMLGARKHPGMARHLPPAPVIAATIAPAPPLSSAALAIPPLPPPPPVTGGPPRFVEAIDVATFQKGNIHTHTTWSDGDRPPQDVYAWYRDRGYNFLAVTDHNTLTDPAIFRLLERKKRFVMITGEEVTMWGAGKQVHVNAICSKSTIGGKKLSTQREALTWGVAHVRAQGGVALVNHPNWDWALTADDLPAARGAALLEIWSGHPHVRTLGDETHLSHEAMWDRALTGGEHLAGVAVDDAHIYGARAPDNAARPGRAWIYAFANEVTRPAICAALAAGNLYASTGVTLKRIVVKDDVYAVYPADRAVKVEFVGWGGEVLQSGKADDDGAARYKLKGREGYVRARVIDEAGKRAWTQPSRVAG